jgi:hypothetical protein
MMCVGHYLEGHRQDKSIHVWQYEVQDDQVRSYARLQSAGLPAGCRDARTMPGKLQGFRERPSGNHMVLNYRIVARLVASP